MAVVSSGGLGVFFPTTIFWSRDGCNTDSEPHTTSPMLPGKSAGTVVFALRVGQVVMGSRLPCATSLLHTSSFNLVCLPCKLQKLEFSLIKLPLMISKDAWSSNRLSIVSCSLLKEYSAFQVCFFWLGWNLIPFCLLVDGFSIFAWNSPEKQQDLNTK
jgi:hypothetical protein